VTASMFLIPLHLLHLSKPEFLMCFHRREQGSRIVGQLLTLMDGNKKSSKKLPHVVVVASTNRLDIVVPDLMAMFTSLVSRTRPSYIYRLIEIVILLKQYLVP
jgi:SpoVK/Ycf46/Vps4 family AAA+-type ATPase